MSKKQDKDKLQYWQRRVENAKSAWETQRKKMDRRELQYSGDRKLTKLVEQDNTEQSAHVWNITAENIESIVDSTIPKPKVTPRREKDQKLAKIIEHMLLNELDRLPMEGINDMQERTVPLQGGALYHVEWDNSERGNDRIGEVEITAIHPKMLIPQDGVYTDIEDMDFVGLMIPQTKGSIKRMYGVDVHDEAESDPEIKAVAGDGGDSSEDMVTQYLVYYRNGDAIGRISWVNDVLLEDLEDYQARIKKRCAKCGALEDTESLILSRPTEDGLYPEGAETEKKAEKGVCSYCGSTKWEDSREDYMELLVPVSINGEMVGGSEPQVDAYGNTVAVATDRIPYYKPKIFPIVLQKNVSVFGQLLGDSDADKIQDQQNTVNRLEQKIIDRLLKAGSRVSLPPQTNITIDPKDGETWHLENPADKQYIGVYDFSGNLQYEMAYLNQVYQESRNILGITDSYQGRSDTTAKSGVAKQFAAQQSAGRMESKRVMKQAAYGKLFELIFKLKLAFCDETRPVFYRDERGKVLYEKFNRFDFLERDEAGNWRWNTDFLFSVDDTGGLAANRGQLWQELTAQLQSGAMGDPASMDTLIDYWGAMEELHYPYAGKMRQRLVERQEAMMNAQTAAAQMQVQMPVENEVQNPLSQPAADSSPYL